MNKVYDYLDYRQFLKERIGTLREQGQFSFRKFNRTAGFKSSSALKLVLDGKRNLAQQGIYRVIRGLKLPAAEAKFFTHLVQMNQARSHDEKDHHFRQLVTYRPFREAQELTALQYECLSHWYYVAILELARLEGFRGDPEWIARKLNPPIGLNDARRALNELRQLKFLVPDGDGKLRRTAATFATPDEVRSHSLVNFHREMCDLAKRAVGSIPSRRREFSSLTVTVSETGFEKIKKRIQEFKRELDSTLEADAAPRRHVAQLNFHLFPLTKEGEAP